MLKPMLRKEAHVSQLARMRIDHESETNTPVISEPNADAWWKKVRSGAMVLFWRRDNVKSWLTVMEVTNINKSEHELTGWYYMHRNPASVYRFDGPLCSMRYGAEWKDSKARSYAAPAESLKPKLTRLLDQFDASEVELIYAGFNLETQGKVPRRVCEAADTWLRKAMKSEPHAVKALSFPSDAERARSKKL
jgi:hypothetical protein